MASEPLLHHPTLKDEDEGGLYCFNDQTRVCNQSCMAWCATPDGKDFRDQQFSNCLLLVNAHRAGKHLVVLASSLAAIEKRQAQPSIPTVR